MKKNRSDLVLNMWRTTARGEGALSPHTKKRKMKRVVEMIPKLNA